MPLLLFGSLFIVLFGNIPVPYLSPQLHQVVSLVNELSQPYPLF